MIISTYTHHSLHPYMTWWYYINPDMTCAYHHNSNDSGKSNLIHQQQRQHEKWYLDSIHHILSHGMALSHDMTLQDTCDVSCYCAIALYIPLQWWVLVLLHVNMLYNMYPNDTMHDMHQTDHDTRLWMNQSHRVEVQDNRHRWKDHMWQRMRGNRI